MATICKDFTRLTLGTQVVQLTRGLIGTAYVLKHVFNQSFKHWDVPVEISSVTHMLKAKYVLMYFAEYRCNFYVLKCFAEWRALNNSTL